MCNMKPYHFSRLKFFKSRSNFKVKVTRSKITVIRKDERVDGPMAPYFSISMGHFCCIGTFKLVHGTFQ